jgi:hypothetical protein
VQATIVATIFRSELVVITIEELEPIQGGAKPTIIVIVVVVNIQVEGLKEPITPNLHH